MASLAVTYTFTNGTVASASEVNTNFQDVIDGTSDGTIDFNIAALTAAGTATFNGNVLLGNASGDDVQFNGSLATSIPIKTTRSYDIGSADLGVRTIYFGGNSTHTVAMSAPSSGYSGDVTFALPTSNGTANYALRTDGSGNTSWVALETLVGGLTIANLSDANATKLGLKPYFIGTTYNSVTLNLTSNVGSRSAQAGVLLPYQTQDGQWRVKINVTYSSTTNDQGTGAQITFTGLTFGLDGSTLDQALATFGTAGGPTYQQGGALAIDSSYVYLIYGTATQNVNLTGDVALKDAPTFIFT